MNKYSICVVAIIMLSSIGLAAADNEIKCAWETCGSKVEQCCTDAVYALTVQPAAQWAYYDYNMPNGLVGVFDDSDTGYIDMDGNGVVSPGDVRLTAWHNVPVGDPNRKYEPNTKVFNDDDVGLPLVVPGVNPPAGTQAVMSCVDLMVNGYDAEDPVYVDTNFDGVVSTHDIRLSSDNPWGYPAYTTVMPLDDDRGEALTLIGNGVPRTLLGFVDSDCSGGWTCPDKLYLQQPVNALHDAVVTIGDLRLYIPPEMVGPGPGEPCWEECGTKVEQKDVDAVYALMPRPQARIGFWDYMVADGVFNDADTAYVDMDGNGVVSPGDVRLTAWHNVPVGDPDRKYDPNTKVFNDDDLNLPIPIPNPVGQNGLIKYFDINGMYGYDSGDPVYVDMDQNNVVSLYDIRLWVEPTSPYEPYTTVAPGDADLIEARALVRVGNGNIATLIGYIDSDCSVSWTCPDKLYLEQPPVDRLVTIGDIRLYMPDATSPFYDPDWPECGTKVEQCNIDAVYRLRQQPAAQFGFFDYNIPGGAINVFDDSDTGYVDMDGSNTVTPGDIRLTAWHNVPDGDDRKYEPNTKVANDDDTNLPLVVPGVNAPGTQVGLIKYFDINGMYGYDLGDPLYVDVDNNGVVSLYDIRLWVEPTSPYDPYTTVAPGDLDLIEGRVLLPVGNGVVPAVTIAALIGYIDDDCTNGWTCPDKLYLQQPVQNLGFEMGDLTGWTVYAGNVEVLQATNFAPNIAVPQGQFYCLLSNGAGPIPAPNDPGPMDIDGALGIENDKAILRRGFTTIQPSLLQIRYDFMTSEVTQPALFDDIFQISFDGVPLVQGSVMQNVGPSSPFPDYGPYDGITYIVNNPGGTTDLSTFVDGRVGFATLNVAVPPGSHIIEFYIGDHGNRIVDSGLLIDVMIAPAAAADDLVTIGDDRLYMPPSEIDDDPGECGDVTGDGNVNMLDVTKLFDHVTYGDPIADEDAADVNCDQSINMLDVTLLFDHVTYGDTLNCC